MGKNRKFSAEFKRNVVLRMKNCPNIPKLAQELDLYKNQLYRWRIELGGLEENGTANSLLTPAPSKEAALEAENTKLKKTLADKVLELDFFRGALRRVEAAGRSPISGEPAFTPKSGPERSSKAD